MDNQTSKKDLLRRAILEQYSGDVLPIIAEAMKELNRTKPKEPIVFIAQYLLSR